MAEYSREGALRALWAWLTNNGTTDPASTGPSLAGYPPAQTYLAGQYYTTPAAAVGTLALTLNEARYLPFKVERRMPISSIGLNVTSAATPASGGVLHLGVLNSDGANRPGSVLFDAGTVGSETLGVREIATSQSLAPGIYWLAAVAQVAVCTVSAATGMIPNMIIGTTASNASTLVAINGMSQASVSGGLVTAASLSVVTSTPRVLLKAA